jgi:drug/metabolite transporter (DMT)-like permease
MFGFRLGAMTLLAMVAFAANSLLCRLALKSTAIDPATFTGIRILSGALVLSLILLVRSRARPTGGSWMSALALFAYAAAFSFAYVDLAAATGALLLFGAVQVTMIGRGLWTGERLHAVQQFGLLLAVAGLVGLLLPGLAAPSLEGAVLMLVAGLAWGVYSLRGRGAGDPLQATAGNFVRAVPLAAAFSLLMLLTLRNAVPDVVGAAYAVASGAVASGIGYAVWYVALRGLKTTSAAIVQLSVPVIAAAGGVVLLGEPLTLRLVLASAAVLGGVAVVLLGKRSTG